VNPRCLGRHVTPVAHGGVGIRGDGGLGEKPPVLRAGSFMPGNPSRAVAPLPVTIADWRRRAHRLLVEYPEGGSFISSSYVATDLHSLH
jgi:hypothetical protein